VPKSVRLATLRIPAEAVVSEPDQHDSSNRPNPRAFIGLGIEMAVAIVLFMFAGSRLDVWLGTAPWLFVVVALVGVAVAFYGFFKRVLPTPRNPEV
jgi:F0F1-type ATP synthase assembly protein I